MYKLKITQMTPFTIAIPQEVLNDLSVRLKQTRWTDEPENAGWSYGTNLAYLRELVDHWQYNYDWRTQETYLNKFPQFKTEIEGINVHFIYVKGKSKDAKPLILTHGWPDSFYRFHKIIPMLTDPESYGGNADEAFDVVIPSIPGFGFLGGVPQNSDQTARLWARLMTDVLGYQTFFAAGGDMGATISKSLANQYPSLVSAIHITDVGYPNGQEDWSTMSAPEQEFGGFIQQWFFTEGAFNLLQSTKPQTLGYGLNDSPVGLASWIIEKFHGWSGKPENLNDHYTKDELITNIMIYWITQTINTSIRTYAEEGRATWTGGLKSDMKVEVPTGVSLFPGEAPFPIEWANRKVNVQRFNIIEKGSHFAALSVPALYVKELRDFFYNRP
ncbi:epoxide hydrolase family protein [Chitinophaga sp. YR627]|uniref:epoxide hydrolase family protein n=1 Tax=Chitinophaga sp. YR627 TaxID=1881041 RepID=UPI002101A994|nr:epoxide hydrolase family protein [Chitinophaga sp. YR627]